MKLVLRSFSLGIIITSILIGAALYLPSDTDKKSKGQSPITTESATLYLTEKGYQVVENAEWLELTETLESQKNQIETLQSQTKTPELEEEEQTEKEELNEKNTEKEQEEVKTNEDDNQKDIITIEIKPGMSSYDVSSVLYQNKLIDDEKAFNAYLEDNAYSQHIQVGKYQLQIGMSFYEIAENITK